MRPRIAFLHTATAHIDTFDQLVRSADPALPVEHRVDESLLARAQQVGADDPELVARVHEAMEAAARCGAPLVVCTCSTVGGAAERMSTGGRFETARIDRAMADRAVELGPRVLVVAALPSTLAPTTALIHDCAAARGRPVRVSTVLVSQAWPHFQRGDLERYHEAVAEAVRGAAPAADVVVLAQASMAPAAARLQGLGIEVLASPAIGVRTALARLDALALRVRELQAHELPDLLGLYRHLHRDDADLPGQAVIESVWQEIRANPRLRYYGGFVDGRLIATCTLALIPNLTRGCRPYGLIENVATHAQHRQRGHGRVMLRHALDEAWSAGCYKVMLMTGRKDDAVFRFYEGAGFERHGKQAFVARPD